MNLRSLCDSATMQTINSSNRASLAMLCLRLFMGVAFVLHGYGKIMSPFDWMGPDAPVPGFLQALGALAEFGGGIALILGFATWIASLGLIITMAVAFSFHFSRGDGFFGGYELALVYLVNAFVLLLCGAGKYSLDAKCKERCAVAGANA